MLGIGIVIVMTTWRSGRRLPAERMPERRTSFDELMKKRAEVARVPGTGVFLARDPSGFPHSVARLRRAIRYGNPEN